MTNIQTTERSRLEISIDFAAPETRDQFKADFREWYRHYNRVEASENGISPHSPEDVSGYLLTDTITMREVGQSLREDLAPGLKVMSKLLALGTLGTALLLGPWMFVLGRYT